MSTLTSETMPSAVSVIVPTLGRVREVRELLASLVASDVVPLEILLVDQNSSGVLDEVVQEFAEVLPIRHERVSFRGASRARNHGVRQARGELVCFPDDDCRVFPETLTMLTHLLDSSGADLVFGKCTDDTGRNSVVAFSPTPAWLHRTRLDGLFAEATMGAHRQTLLEFPFDEAIGAGTFHGAEEAFDLVWRLLRAGRKLYYSPKIVFYHPQAFLRHDNPAAIRRVFAYRCGFGRVCVKHRLYRRLLKRTGFVLAALPILLLVNQHKARYYIAELLGIIAGVVIR